MMRWNTNSSEDMPNSSEFEEYGMSLGDMMRGERATMGKSLLDVQRDLKIKASYISAIEDCNPDVFETPGFIAGYVRSYARYLSMDSEKVFAAFCQVSGFSTAHGMSQRASSSRIVGADRNVSRDNPFSGSPIPFTPEHSGFLSGIDPRGVGSVMVLLALIIGLGYGGWTILRQVQTVQFAPVEQAPDVTAALDPLAGGVTGQPQLRPSAEAFERLYRPRSLEIPIMASRDAPIATLQPMTNDVAAFTAVDVAEGQEPTVVADASVSGDSSGVQVSARAPEAVALLAVRPVWVRLRATDGSVILETTLDAGEEYILPADEVTPTLRAGNSGSLFFRVGADVYGPAGSGSSTIKNLIINTETLQARYQIADSNSNQDLSQFSTIAALTISQ